MAQTFKVLGQNTPTAATLTALYTCGATNGTVISSLIVTNTDVFPSTFMVSLAVAGAADTPSQYLYYNLPIAASDTFIATIGVTVANTDQIRVESASGKINFTLVGVENN